jgi:hypothetical protein
MTHFVYFAELQLLHLNHVLLSVLLWASMVDY